MNQTLAEPGARLELGARLSQTAREIETVLAALLPLPAGPERRVVEAMRYAALGGGKQIGRAHV